MDQQKEHILNWLTELEQTQAVDFFIECEVEHTFLKTLFFMNGDGDTAVFDVTISVPLKMHHKIAEYSKEVSVIEQAIKDAGQSTGIYVQHITWKPYLKNSERKRAEQKAGEITELLTQEYVDRQIRLMNQSIDNNSYLALGIAKELIETCCKHILNKANVSFNRDWDIAKLVKETNKHIQFMPSEVENIELARSAILKILGGFSNIIHGVTELRNSYGSGHGHLPEFKTLDVIYVKLAVASSSEMAIFYLSLAKLNDKK